MDFLFIWMFTSILGIVVLLKPMSANESVERKKNMGVWRCESEQTARMMSRFPSTVTTCIVKNSPKKKSCSSESSENPRSWNSKVLVKFTGFM
jgi:hypothetical protein